MAPNRRLISVALTLLVSRKTSEKLLTVVFIFIVIKSSKCQYFIKCYEIRLYALSIILYLFFLDDVGKTPSYCHYFVVTWNKSQSEK